MRNILYTRDMTDPQTSFNTITSPAEAVDQFVGEQFIEWAMQYLAEETKAWEPLAALASGTFKPEKIRKFLLQRFVAEEVFSGMREGDPGFLGFAIANLSEVGDPMAENALELLNQRRQNLAGKELWGRLLKAMQATDEEISRAEPKEGTREYVAELSDLYSTGEWQSVVGAVAAYERIRALEAQVLITFLKNNTSLNDKDWEILSGYASGNSEAALAAGHILDKAVLDSESKQLVWEGIKRQADASREFLSNIMKYLS